MFYAVTLRLHGNFCTRAQLVLIMWKYDALYLSVDKSEVPNLYMRMFTPFSYDIFNKFRCCFSCFSLTLRLNDNSRLCLSLLRLCLSLIKQVLFVCSLHIWLTSEKSAPVSVFYFKASIFIFLLAIFLIGKINFRKYTFTNLTWYKYC